MSEPLQSLLSKARKGEIVLPEFQRDFVWKPVDVIKLITSILNKYPISSILLMESDGSYQAQPLHGIINQVEAATNDQQLVLDGQQRLTSCYKAFCDGTAGDRYPGKYYFDYGKFIDADGDISGSELEDLIIFKKQRDCQRLLPDTASEQACKLFPLQIIFNCEGINDTEWLNSYNFQAANNNQAEFERLTRIQSRFVALLTNVKAYQVQFELIPRGTSPDVICTVFETINTTGKKLTVFDLLIARCYARGVRLRDLLRCALDNQDNKYIRLFDDVNGEDICVITLPKIIALKLHRSSKRSVLLGLTSNEISDNWNEAVSALNKALEILHDLFGSFGYRFIPIPDMIAPLAVILSDDRFSGSEDDFDKLQKWYWRCVFSQYFSSSADTKAAKSVRDWLDDDGWLASDIEPDSVKNFTLSQHLLSDVCRSDNSVYRGVLSVLLTNPYIKDLGIENRLFKDVGASYIQDHHIYPARFLEPYGIKGDRVNTIINRTPLWCVTNLLLSNDAPHFYMRDLNRVSIGNPDNSEVLKGHFIPKVVLEPFTTQVYDTFIKDRENMLLNRIRQLVVVDELSDDDF